MIMIRSCCMLDRSLLAALLAQVPNPTPAINAAKDAQGEDRGGAAEERRGARSAARRAAAPRAAPPAAGEPPPPRRRAGAAPPAPQGAGYSYDPAGRRDPFVSLTARGGDVRRRRRRAAARACPGCS